MDTKGNKRATSAGYRLPDPPNVALISQSSVSVYKLPPNRTRNTRGGESPWENPDSRDPVKQDQVWSEFVRAERNGVKEWQKNWSFLKNYDQLGNHRAESPLPNYVPVFSDHIPNTTNQMFGSRVCTPLGRELMRMDKLLIESYRKCKQGPDMQPC
ncbi:ciliary microtubule inner protein 5 [Salvelinus alpinus]